MRASKTAGGLLALLLCTSLLLAVPGAAGALTCDPELDVEWTGAGDGVSLDDPANWETEVLPGPEDTACIGDDFTGEALTLDQPTELTVQVLRSSAAITVTGGLLELLDDSEVDAPLTVSGGELRIGALLQLGNIEVPQTLTLTDGGRLTGSGTIEGALDNPSGVIAPGTAVDVVDRIGIIGDLTQGPDGTYEVDVAEIDGWCCSDTVDVSGTATLDGRALVTVTSTASPPTTPELGQAFTIIGGIASRPGSTWADVVGDLEVVDASPGDGVSFETRTDQATLSLVTIEEPPPPPLVVDLSDVEVEEGDDGTTDVEISATLNREAPEEITLQIEVTGVTGRQQLDFMGAPGFAQALGEVKIPAGSTGASLLLEIIGDGEPEPDETIDATILSASPATVEIGQASATITIVDDDPAPSLTDPSLNPVGFGDTCLVDTDGLGLIKGTPPSPGQIALLSLDCAEPQEVDTVLIGRDDDFADSLSSGYLQGEAPLLLVPGPGPIPADVRTRLLQMAPQQVVIMGGVDAVRPAVAEELVALGFEVVRREGPTRIETAVDVAEQDAASATTAIIARAYATDEDQTQAFADAIAAGGMAADLGYPVLLTDTTALSTSTASYLRTSAITDVLVMGGTAAVSEAVVQQLAEIVPGTITRVAGDSRAGTAIEIAKERGSDSADGLDGLIVVEGQAEFAWAAGLTAAYESARDDAPIVLLSDEVVPPETAAYLTGPPAGSSAFAIEPGDGEVTCAAAGEGCRAARRLLGLDDTPVTFDPAPLSDAVLGATIGVDLPDLPDGATVTYSGSCLIAPTTDPTELRIRDDMGGPPLPCLVVVVITHPSGVTQTARAAYTG